MKKTREIVVTTETLKDNTGNVLKPEREVCRRMQTVYQKADGSLWVHYVSGRRQATRDPDGLVYHRHETRQITKISFTQFQKRMLGQ